MCCVAPEAAAFTPRSLVGRFYQFTISQTMHRAKGNKVATASLSPWSANRCPGAAPSSRSTLAAAGSSELCSGTRDGARALAHARGEVYYE